MITLSRWGSWGTWNRS